MDILTWIIVGLVAGTCASFVVRGGYGLIGNIVLGVVGAFVGGFLFTRFGGPDVTGLNLMSIVVATVGAIVVLVLYHALSGRRRI